MDRRRFLRLAPLAVAVIAVPAVASPVPDIYLAGMQRIEFGWMERWRHTTDKEWVCWLGVWDDNWTYAERYIFMKKQYEMMK